MEISNDDVYLDIKSDTIFDDKEIYSYDMEAKPYRITQIYATSYDTNIGQDNSYSERENTPR